MSSSVMISRLTDDDYLDIITRLCHKIGNLLETRLNSWILWVILELQLFKIMVASINHPVTVQQGL